MHYFLNHSYKNCKGLYTYIDVKHDHQAIKQIFNKNIVTYWKSNIFFWSKKFLTCINPILYPLPDFKEFPMMMNR